MTDNGPVIYVDADACPVKDEIYRVVARHGVRSVVVANRYIRIPRDPLIEAVVVPAGLDAADDWIAARAGPRALVVTADVPLAARAVKAGALALAPNGRAFTPEAIGMALATRNLMEDLRSAGMTTAGPPLFSNKDRSAFLSALHIALTRLLRDQGERAN